MSSLSTHIKNVHEGVKHTCTICGFITKTRSYLCCHMTKKHGKKTIPKVYEKPIRLERDSKVPMNSQVENLFQESENYNPIDKFQEDLHAKTINTDFSENLIENPIENVNPKKRVKFTQEEGVKLFALYDLIIKENRCQTKFESKAKKLTRLHNKSINSCVKYIMVPTKDQS